MSTYSSRLRDPRWQKKRLELLDKAKWSCCKCGSESSELHCHHLIYRKGKSPWEYSDSEIIVLCSQCHEYITNLQSAINERIITFHAQCPGNDDALHVILGFLDGLCGLQSTAIKEEAIVAYCNGLAHADHGKMAFRDKYFKARDKMIGRSRGDAA